MSAIPEHLLLSQFKAGNHAAFEMVFKAHYPALRLAAFTLLNDAGEAEDVTQQLFVDIWNKQLYKNIDTALRSYLHTAIRNRCFNILERRKTQAKAAADYLYTTHENADTAEATITYQEEMGSFLEKTLQSFPQQRLTALQLVYLDNKSYKEAADNMGISVNSVKTHLKLGLKSLRSLLRATT